MTVYALLNGRTNALCGIYTSNLLAIQHAMDSNIDSWYIVAIVLDREPVRLA